MLLNLFILHTNITDGRKWYYRFCSIFKESSESEQASRIYNATSIAMAVFNFLYLTATVVMYTKYNIPPIHKGKCTALSYSACSPPHSSTLYKDQVTSLIVKVVVILTAIIVSLLVAIKSTLKSTLPTASPCSKCLRIILLLNYFVFVQIITGLISLPLCVFLIISPLQTISILCAGTLIILLITMSVVCLLQLGDIQIRTCKYKSTSKVCANFSRHLILVALFATIIALYFWLSPTASELSGIERITFSLVPPIALSVIAWVVKRRFLSNNMGKRSKTERKLSAESTSTQQEYLQETEQEYLQNTEQEYLQETE